jgi:hypothetical protein
MDGHRQWHNASFGIGVCQAEREKTSVGILSLQANLSS